MPTIFLLAFAAFIVLVVLIVLIAVFAFGFRPSRNTHIDSPPSSGGSDFTGLNP